jgi:hypothetical protein
MVLPIIQLDWNPNPEWRVRIGIPETRVDYRAWDDVTLFLGAHFDFKDYRVDGDDVLEDAVVRDSIIGLELGAVFALGETTDLEIAGGATLNREITVDDEDGDELLEEELENGAFLTATLTFRF